jgi:hypothetical protein
MPINLETDKYRSILIREFAKQRPQAKHIDVFWPEEEVIVASIDGTLYAMEIGSDDDYFLFINVNSWTPNYLTPFIYYHNDSIKFDYPEDWLA